MQRNMCESDFRYSIRTKLGFTDADRALKAIKKVSA